MKRKYSSRWALALAAAVVFAGGASAQASEVDDGIGPAFKQTYVYKVFLQDDSIQADAKDGVVTLTGTVAEESHKALAEDTVANLPGVVRVDNQLVTTSELAAENADGWIVRKVKLALMFHQNVNAGKTSVEAEEGVVTLKGEAASEAQKTLTGEYAADIEGVTSVKNEMTVVESPVPAERTMGEKLDDMSIAAQVKTALLTHRSTSAIQTKVASRDGEVTLTGVAQSEAEKALAGKLVADIHGVTSVKNEMTVEEVVVK
ncbi:MAG TPA: transport-associated protein [Verrucomicrobia bacterium]|nr:transport-associated protein [Verrucomicrobiota bacterium]